jgi:Glyoxalase-like domain
MNWELDHVFLTVPELARSERLLAEFGMTFTERGVHRGQGTSNACAMFENAFFELLAAHDLAELESDLVKPLGLHERMQWLGTGACPFGVCFGLSDGGIEAAALPFQTWPYAPPYVRAGTSIPIVTPRGHIREPMVFLSTRPRASFRTTHAQHRGATRTLTKICVTLPPLAEPVSEGVRWFAQQESFTLKSGPSYLLELEWDGGREQQSALLDDLLLLVRW